MFRRRKKKNKLVNESPPESPPSDQAPDINKPPPATVGVYQETKTSPVLTDAFKSTFEKAADRSKIELISVGKIKPMAFFVSADGTMKNVCLSINNEQQQDVLIQRLREKVFAENVSTVIILTEMDGEHTAVLSGASPNMRGSASIDYSFDKTTKTVASWKLIWLDKPAQNVFLDGIFDKTG